MSAAKFDLFSVRDWNWCRWGDLVGLFERRSSLLCQLKRRVDTGRTIPGDVYAAIQRVCAGHASFADTMQVLAIWLPE